MTFQYYHGVTAFLDEDYSAADESLSEAFRLLPLRERGYNTQSEEGQWALSKNRDLVLTYLIPVRLVTKSKLPSIPLLRSSTRLQHLFSALCGAIKTGNLRAFDEALARGEAEFVKRRIYLTLERAREVCLRNLLRKVVLAAGWEEGKEGVARRSRIKIEDFIVGVRCALGYPPEEEREGERDEVEWMVAGCIYKVSEV